MATLIINANEMFTIDVTARESDEYTQAVYLRFDRNYLPESKQPCSEMYLTPIQLELLGRFLLRQADEIRTVQAQR